MDDPPLLTADLPGIGGRIKAELEDFEVDELPAYLPAGAGPHLYLFIEKRDLGAEYFVKQVALRLGVRPGDVGTAGMKDRRAVTRQWVSVPAEAEPRLAQLDGPGIRVLETSRHGNKLKPGHLRGNRFRVLIRDADPDAAARAERVLAVIRDRGLPNYYGPQRFGQGGETADLGFRQLRDGPDRKLSPFLRKLSLSAAQSALFNDYLGRRLADGLLRTVLDGDVLAKRPAGGLFVSADPATDQPRLDAREVVPAGPMFGKKLFPAAGEAARRESDVLARRALTPESFGGFGQLLDGTRRHNLVYVDDVACASEPAGLRLEFSLPSGSYATVLLREVMKSAAAADA
jgi:tRNA pseudouridine13 synthase